MSIPIIERRRAEQRARINAAAAWAERFAAGRRVTAVVVFGSTVRGDFNKWSDVDVLVIAEDLPAEWRSRAEMVMADTPPGLQPVGWTSAELAERRRRRDPIAVECDVVGVVIYGALPATEPG
ncbi:MAG: nucleotidyltransferase domain-containing protein [Actinomycetota bacterium]|nr:nucleotidyltransferase domain-containing protein [Actinomycetota bacterium]